MDFTNRDPPVIAPDRRLPPPAAAPRKRLLEKGIIAALGAATLFAIFFWIHPKHNETQKPGSPKGGGAGPVAITGAAARRGDIGDWVRSIGTVTPVYTATITSQVTGTISRVRFSEGQLVKKGDPLIDIDDRPFRATLLQARGALERDQNVLAQARMDLDRYRTAWARNAIPKQQLDDQEKIVLQDQGTVKNDQGLVQFDQVQVDFCRISAPFSGRVGLRLVDPGNVVQAAGVQSSSSAPLAVVTQLQPITVVFPVPEDSIDLIQSHAPDGGAKLIVDVYDRADRQKIESGTLMTLDNQIDTTTGTVKARAQFDNSENRLFPNQFVNAHLLVARVHGVTVVPSAAIQHNGQVAFVYVLTNDVASTRQVKAGATDGGMTQVEGIAPGDVVATNGFERLQDKAKVTIAREPATAPATVSSNASGGSEAP